jgi:hypothetical protein
VGPEHDLDAAACLVDADVQVVVAASRLGGADAQRQPFELELDVVRCPVHGRAEGLDQAEVGIEAGGSLHVA